MVRKMERRKTVKVCRCCEWYEEGKSGMLGKCRERPPEVFDGWLSVYEDDWCGRWKCDKEKMMRVLEEGDGGKVEDRHIGMVVVGKV